MNFQAKLALFRIEDRLSELPQDAQAKIQTLATVLDEFVSNHGALGHHALNLVTARKAVQVLPE